mmetsp:Transcript_6130/g.9836  ORF Transcript_6130/g.9836 Transcript_6130/m.9836 type:complete len:174 (+) Transcript_6130:1189-1710(+)
MRIPKIALNFTKWRLQQRMVTDLRALSDPKLVQKRMARYTECYDLLDRLGADNCIDPDDFDQEDLNDDLFKNLKIQDIDDILDAEDDCSEESESVLHHRDIVSDHPVLNYNSGDDNLTDDGEPLLVESLASELKNEEDLQFMDFDEQMKIYDQMQQQDESSAGNHQSKADLED